MARCCLVFLVMGAASVRAQTVEPINWVYGAYFGTGYYELVTGEETYVLGARPSWRWREPGIAGDGRRSIGIEFRVPFAIGAHELDAKDLSSTLSFQNVSTVSAVPGVEIEIPINERWSLRPLAYAGWGTQTDGDAWAWIYWAGIKSRVRFGGDGLDWALINALTYVGYSDNASQRGNGMPLFTALEFGQTLRNKRLRGEVVRLHWHVGYTQYVSDFDLIPAASNAIPVEMEDEWDVGLAFSTGDEPLRLWRLKWDRIGLVFRFSSDREARGIGLNFRSVFYR